MRSYLILLLLFLLTTNFIPAQSDDKVYELREVDVKPGISKPRKQGLKKQKWDISEIVKAKIVIDEKGFVTEIVKMKGAEIFFEDAKEYLFQKIDFYPAQKNGHYVKCYLNVAIKYFKTIHENGFSLQRIIIKPSIKERRRNKKQRAKGRKYKKNIRLQDKQPEQYPKTNFNEPVIKYALLNNAVDFTDYNNKTLKFKAGSLVRYRMNYYKSSEGAKENKTLYLIDKNYSTSTVFSSSFSEDDIRFIEKSTADSIAEEISNDLNFIFFLTDKNYSGYIGALSQEGKFSNFLNCYFKTGQPVYLYQNSKLIATSTIVEKTVYKSPLDIQDGILFKIEQTNIKNKDKTIISLKPLNQNQSASTPDYTKLLNRKKNLEHGEQYYNFKFITTIDFDNDGINELIFQEIGFESISYAIFKYKIKEWENIHNGWMPEL